MDATKLNQGFSLESSVAVVTGASSGLGRRFAQVLHGAGAVVIAGARREDRLEQLATELGRRLVPVPCDITKSSDRDHLIDVALASSPLGRIDVLVNNAGASTSFMPGEDEPVERFQFLLEANVTSAFALAQRAGQSMLSQGKGSIINIASIMGLGASYPLAQAGYCASKGAVVNLTRELACQWAGRGVRVNAIAPGWFPSEMTDELLNDERSRKYLERTCPMGRIGEPSELDGALLFLASSASSYCTGQILAIDGGWSSR